MAVSTPHDAASTSGPSLISGCYAVDPAQELSQYGGGHPCFAATDQRLGRRDLMAVQASPNAPARSLPISALASVTIENMLLPLAHGRAATGHGTNACFIIMPRPTGGKLPHRPMVPAAPWAERELLDCALRPLARALDQLHRIGMTHRAIRPNNLFRAKMGHALTLGGAWAAPPASAQPCVFEPPYSAMCHQAGRGDGSIADDVYALGVLLVTLAAGSEPMAGQDDEAIIRAKLERGSFTALTANLNLSSTITDLLRGMLAEDPDHRPSPALLADPHVARSRRLATRPRPRAPRPLDLGGIAAADARTLAYAMHRAPRIAIALLRSAAIDTWLRRTLGDPALAAKLDEIVRGGNDDPIGGRARSDSLLLMRAIAVLDPLAPLCWQGLALFPDGIGPVLADVGAYHTDAPAAAKIEAIIENELCAIWGEARPARSDIALLRLDCRQQRILLRTAGWAGGLSRVSYALNLLLPCRSPQIAHEAILRIHELIPAWDRRAGSHPGSPPIFVIDPESAAFIAARFNGRMDSDLAILAQLEDPDIDPPGHRGLAQLRVLTQLSEQDTANRWPALAEIAAFPARAALSQWKGRTARAERERALAEAISVGSIPTMLTVLVDPSAKGNDASASQAATQELHRIDAEITRLIEARAWRGASARNTGHEVAAGLGIITLAGAAVFAALL
jgi:hypothetical protein